MILGVATKLPADSLLPWAKSARKVCDHVVLLTDQPLRYTPLEEFVDLVPADFSPKGHCDIVRVRWREIAHFLKSEDGPVCVVDTRDAVFQTSPLGRIADKMIIGSEGLPHKDNGWSWGWVKLLCPDWYDRIADEPILCAGAIGGPAPLLRDFALAMYHRLPEISCSCTDGQAHMGDQALVNVLVRDGWKDRFEITDDWAFHAMGAIPAGLSYNGDVVNANEQPYAIVHQYDRRVELSHLG